MGCLLSEQSEERSRCTSALCESAEDEDVLVRLHSIKALRSWGSQSDAVLRTLNEAIVDSHPAVRWEALWALGRLWHGPRHELPNLAVALEDDDLGVQGQALIALTGIGATETEVPIPWPLVRFIRERLDQTVL
jgi:HEAT repeat protein